MQTRTITRLSFKWKYFIGGLFLVCAGTVKAQNPTPPAYNSNLTVSYIRAWTATAPITSTTIIPTRTLTDVKLSTQFFDGLGNPLQTVVRQQSPLKKDMVTPTVYDNMLRESYSYLSFIATPLLASDSTADGYFKMDAFQQDSAFNHTLYPGQTYYYGQVNFEKSPMQRPLFTYPVGNSWVGSGRSTAKQYLVNESGDSVQLWSISPTIGSNPFRVSAYLPGQLYKNVTIDESSHQVVEYKDKEGHVVLKKVQLSGTPATGHVGWLCTYYVYDTLRNLRFVLPPALINLINGTFSINQTEANGYCFRYEYDSRKRMIIKKEPGAGETWMVYDADNRLVMSQDSCLRKLGKWLVTEYDGLGRAWRTGLLTDANNRVYHQNLAKSSTSYPNTSGGNYEILTQTFFDNYSWVSGTGLSASLIAVSNPAFITAYNTSPLYAQSISQNLQTRGLVTGTKTKVVGSASQYLYAVNFYDDHNRIIQTESINYTGGLDTLTNQYDFYGRVLCAVFGHQKAGNTVQNHLTVTKYTYDSVGRQLTVSKNIDHAPSDQLLASMQYDELGRLKSKHLGNQLDSLAYSYNIRSWMTGINKNFVGGGTMNYFGQELAFDDPTSVTGTNYAAAQYNGNVTGLTWKTKGDSAKRKYNFTYDTSNRLSGAVFLQNTGSGWSNGTVDYSVQNLTYDGNGNIMTMFQRGLKLNTSALIDSLVYSYATDSNELIQVVDGDNDTASILGDFHYKGTKLGGTRDYKYDGNGNLVADNNKGIDSIGYNYLNLPQYVDFKGKGNITYTYDAAGNKLRKQTLDSVSKHSITILYLDDFVYQQTDTMINPGSGVDTLQFIGNEEGRTRWAFHKYLSGSTGYRFEYDFFEKDHLGNTRVVLSQEQDTAIYAATMETKNAALENQLFNNVSTTQYTPPPAGFEPSTGGDTSNHAVCMLNGSSGGNRIGPSIVLKVMAGDTVSASVYGWYQGSTQPAPSPETPLVNDLLSLLTGDVMGQAAGKFGSLSTPVSNALNASMPSFFSNVENPDYNSAQPKAFLNWVLFDDQLNFVAGNVVQMPSVTVGQNKQVMQASFPASIPKNGYLYIYLSNESQQQVFFDNLNIQFKPGPLLEETHYYPFGLTMAGISDKALKTNYAENKFKFTGQLYDDDLTWDTYQMKHRTMDPQLGRFLQIDPLASTYVYNSTYAYAENRVINGIDLEGTEWTGRVATTRNYDLDKRSYRETNSYIPRARSYRVSGNYIPNQAAGSAPKPADIYEPFTPGSGEQFWGPTITKGNDRGKGVVGMTNGIDALVADIQSVTSKTDFMVTPDGHNVFWSVDIKWSNKEAEQQFNNLQSEYNSKVQDINNNNKLPPPPGPNATPEQLEKWGKEVNRAIMARNIQMEMLGPSPIETLWDKLHNSKDFTLTHFESHNLPEITSADY